LRNILEPRLKEICAQWRSGAVAVAPHTFLSARKLKNSFEHI